MAKRSWAFSLLRPQFRDELVNSAQWCSVWAEWRLPLVNYYNVFQHKPTTGRGAAHFDRKQAQSNDK